MLGGHTWHGGRFRAAAEPWRWAKDQIAIDRARRSNYIVYTMKSSIVKIGNSQGIRIPKPVLRQCGLEGDVQLEVRDQELVIRSAHSPRHNWRESFQQMAQRGDDKLLETPPSSWDERDWEWK
jgi:antitoxin MazE